MEKTQKKHDFRKDHVFTLVVQTMVITDSKTLAQQRLLTHKSSQKHTCVTSLSYKDKFSAT